MNEDEKERKAREAKLKEITDLRLRNPLFEKRIWTISETADFLDLTVGTIYNLTSKKKKPVFKKKEASLLFSSGYPKLDSRR